MSDNPDSVAPYLNGLAVGSMIVYVLESFTTLVTYGVPLAALVLLTLGYLIEKGVLLDD